MKKVISLLCMCLMLTSVGDINVASAEQCTNNCIESFAENGTTIVFDANGGKGTMENGAVSDDYKLPKSKFKKSGYKFAGWCTAKENPNPDNFFKVGTEGYYVNFPDSTSTLYAIWVKSKAYKISYDLGKGMKLSKSVKTYTSGKATKLPSIKDSNEFNGWMFTINGQEYGPIFEIPPYMTGKIKLRPLMIGFEG